MKFDGLTLYGLSAPNIYLITYEIQPSFKQNRR